MIRSTAFSIMLTLLMIGHLHARPVPAWSYTELFRKSDLVVVVVPTATRDAKKDDQIPPLEGIEERVAGVVTTFEVLAVAKGTFREKQLIIKHYREIPVNDTYLGNGPVFVSFKGMLKNSHFMLFLRKVDDREFEFVTGQHDPLYSVKRIHQHPYHWPSAPQNSKAEQTKRYETIIPTARERIQPIRFIRLKYLGGDWDRGASRDLTMLKEYETRTGHPIASKTESRSVADLKSFPIGKGPHLVYLTGQKNIELKDADVKVLREYLLTKRGMLLGDNGGSRHFHQQFIAMMKHVLPEVRPVRIALDDSIHQIPYSLSSIPYVAPHGGKHPLGWKVDGGWVCYYHPGNIGAAWADNHAGVNRDVYEASYALGTNIIYYAHFSCSKRPVTYKKPDPNELEKQLNLLLDRIDKNIK